MKSVNDSCSDLDDDESDDRFSEDDNSSLAHGVDGEEEEEENHPFPFTEDLQQHFHPV